jgi:hypothetical protein
VTLLTVAILGALLFRIALVAVFFVVDEPPPTIDLIDAAPLTLLAT